MDVEKFISSVFIRSSLWDQKDVHHRNRYLLDKLWEEVAKECGITRDVARSKWKALRDKFRLLLHKIPKLRTGEEGGPTDPYNKISWKYFQSLLFLRDQFTPRRTSGNFSTETLNASTQEELEGLNDEEDSLVNNATEQSYSIDSPILLDEEGDCSSTDVRAVDSPASSFETRSTATPGFNKRKRQRSNYDVMGQALLNVEKEKLDYLKKAKNKTEHDEDSNFFLSILPHVRKLSPADKMAFRINVLQLVQEYIKKGECSPETQTFQVFPATTTASVIHSQHIIPDNESYYIYNDPPALSSPTFEQLE